MTNEDSKIEVTESMEETTALSENESSENKPKKNRNDGFWRHMKKNWILYTFLIIPVVYYVVFRYIPMFGNIIAFRKYSAGGNIFGSQWSGFKYFKQFLGDPAFRRAFGNTLILNFSYLVVRFPLTLIFALLLNEIKWLPWKKFVQTVSYLPHFISMVIVAGMIKEVLSTRSCSWMIPIAA